MIEKIATFLKVFWDWFKSDRCFVKYFIEAFKITNKNILLLTLLILCVFMITVYIIVAQIYSINSILSLAIIILMTSALASGFFYSMKKSIKYYYNEENKETKSITCGTFYTGIGKYYLTFLGISVTFFVMASLVILGTFILANYLVCDVTELNIDNNLFMALANPSAIDFSVLDPKQQLYFRNWNRIFLITTQLFTFMLMYWIPEKMYNNKDVFSALFDGVKKIFSDLPNSICIYLTIVLLNYILAIFTMLCGNNNIAVFILSIFSFYLLAYNFYAIFLYYRARYVEFYERNNE